MSEAYISMSEGLTEVVKRAAKDQGVSVSALARFAFMALLGVDADGNPTGEPAPAVGGLPTPPRRQPPAKRTAGAARAGGSTAVQFSEGDR